MDERIETSLDVVTCFAKRNANIYITFSSYPQRGPRLKAKTIRTLGTGLLMHRENTFVATIAGDQLTKEVLLQMCNQHPGHCLAVRSRVHGSLQPHIDGLCGDSSFIPLLDFSCAITDRNRDFLTEQLDDLVALEGTGGGFLLETTNSYHYYGMTPLNFERWLSFLGRSLLMVPRAEDLKTAKRLGLATVIDARFLGHSLLAKQGSLRISADGNGHHPRVVALIAGAEQQLQ